MIQGWTVLQPSARERRLWAVAIAAGVASSMVLIYGALAMDPCHPGRTWTAAALAADGVPWMRTQPSADGTADEWAARPVFVASW